MATTEKNGMMKYKDSAGNVTTMYPKTKVSQVDGLNEAIEEVKSFIVNVSLNVSTFTYTADKTHAEIKAAYDAKKFCCVEYAKNIFHLSSINSSEVCFTRVYITDTKVVVEKMTITSDSGNVVNVTYDNADYVTPDGMNTAIQSAIQNTWEASY